MEPLPHRHQHSSSQPMLVPSSSFPVGKTVGAISCTTMTLFTKCYPPPLGTRINNTVPALKTTTVNRPVLALKKKRPSRREQKIQPPGPGAEKTQPTAPSRPASKKKYNRPVPPRKKNTTAPSRLGKKKTPPRPASGKKNDRPVPPRKKKQTAPSRLEKKKKTSRPAKNFHPYILPVPRSRRNEKGGSTVNFPPVPSR